MLFVFGVGPGSCGTHVDSELYGVDGVFVAHDAVEGMALLFPFPFLFSPTSERRELRTDRGHEKIVEQAVVVRRHERPG